MLGWSLALRRLACTLHSTPCGRDRARVDLKSMQNVGNLLAPELPDNTTGGVSKLGEDAVPTRRHARQTIQMTASPE